MSLREQIEARMRQARKDRDERAKNVINQIKNRVLTELKSGADVQEDDALWTKHLLGYSKQVKKAIPTFEQAGERGVEALEEARFELAFCEEFLPNDKLDEAQTEALVRKVAAEQSISDPKMMGRLMGMLMKNHREQLDGDLTRQVVQRVLAG